MSILDEVNKLLGNTVDKNTERKFEEIHKRLDEDEEFRQLCIKAFLSLKETIEESNGIIESDLLIAVFAHTCIEWEEILKSRIKNQEK